MIQLFRTKVKRLRLHGIYRDYAGLLGSLWACTYPQVWTPGAKEILGPGFHVPGLGPYALSSCHTNIAQPWHGYWTEGEPHALIVIG